MKKIVVAILCIMAMMTILTVSAEARDRCLVFGLLPAEDPRVMIDRFTPMKNFLEKEIGQCIELFAATDYAGIIEAMRVKKVDFAFFGPLSYVKASERANAVAFATGVDKHGKSGYHSYMVATPEVAKKLGITIPLEGQKGLEIIREKLNNHRRAFTFTFTDIASTSGFGVPRYYMHLVGIVPEKVFRRVGFVGSHDAAALVVHNNIIHMASVYDRAYHTLIDRGRITSDSVVIIWKSPRIPGEPFAYRGDLDPKTRDLLKKAIVRVPKDLTGYADMVGHRLADDSEYNVIRDMNRVLAGLR